jgi:hypothetical protein|tara:strand:+ start:4551 stop:4730 length:180 start_codon:yes stop_codon:yes gene_type:complete
MSRGQTHGGKGDKQRPTAGTFADNWDNIFNKKKDTVRPAPKEVRPAPKDKEDDDGLDNG